MQLWVTGNKRQGHKYWYSSCRKGAQYKNALHYCFCNKMYPCRYVHQKELHTTKAFKLQMTSNLLFQIFLAPIQCPIFWRVNIDREIMTHPIALFLFLTPESWLLLIFSWLQEILSLYFVSQTFLALLMAVFLYVMTIQVLEVCVFVVTTEICRVWAWLLKEV